MDRIGSAAATSPRTRLLAALAAAAALIALPVSGAAAAENGGAAENERLQQRVEFACARVDVLAGEVDRLIEQITGDAQTPGSLAWLSARADKLEAAGQSEAAQAVREREELREQRLDLLRLRAESLAEADASCAEAGL